MGGLSDKEQKMKIKIVSTDGSVSFYQDPTCVRSIILKEASKINESSRRWESFTNTLILEVNDHQYIICISGMLNRKPGTEHLNWEEGELERVKKDSEFAKKYFDWCIAKLTKVIDNIYEESDNHVQIKYTNRQKIDINTFSFEKFKEINQTNQIGN